MTDVHVNVTQDVQLDGEAVVVITTPARSGGRTAALMLKISEAAVLAGDIAKAIDAHEDDPYIVGREYTAVAIKPIPRSLRDKCTTQVGEVIRVLRLEDFAGGRTCRWSVVDETNDLVKDEEISVVGPATVVGVMR